MRQFLLCLGFFLVGCAVKNPVVNQYKLDTYSMRSFDNPNPSLSLFITPPETNYTYQSEQMFYTKKIHTINAFAHNAWISPPATMLFSLMLQSFQSSGYFRAVLTSANVGEADYRLDTQLITLQQNFLTKPSRLELCIKIVLTKMSEERVIASRILHYQLPCDEDTPFAGVVAANVATKQFTEQVTDFVIAHVKPH